MDEETGLIESNINGKTGYRNTIYEPDPKRKKSNLINRLVFILTGVWCCNKKYENDKADDILFNLQKHFLYKNESMMEIDTTFYCLCGHRIHNVCILNYENKEVYIGIECVKNFFKQANVDLNLQMRKTFDCKICKIRCSKEDNNIDLGICNKCDEIKFGKYKGRKFSQINDNNYLEWCLSDFKKLQIHTKKTIKLILKNNYEISDSDSESDSKQWRNRFIGYNCNCELYNGCHDDGCKYF